MTLEDLYRGKYTQELEPIRLCGVYFLVLKQRVVYIGKSINIAARVLGHGDKKFDKILWIQVSEHLIEAYEAALIRAFRPQLNWGTNPSYLGDDNDILESLGLPSHEDEEAIAGEWEREFKRKRAKLRRENREYMERSE